MQNQFTSEQIRKITEQASAYQCACPAQVCELISHVRNLYSYQESCLNRNDTERQVHQTIAERTEKIHDLLEQLLDEVLDLEGWDRETLELPEFFDKVKVEDLEKLFESEDTDQSSKGSSS